MLHNSSTLAHSDAVERRRPPHHLLYAVAPLRAPLPLLPVLLKRDRRVLVAGRLRCGAQPAPGPPTGCSRRDRVRRSFLGFTLPPSPRASYAALAACSRYHARQLSCTKCPAPASANRAFSSAVDGSMPRHSSFSRWNAAIRSNSAVNPTCADRGGLRAGLSRPRGGVTPNTDKADSRLPRQSRVA